MHQSKPKSLTTTAHFFFYASDTDHPKTQDFANLPDKAANCPAAPDTTSVSLVFGLPISSNPV